MIIGFLETLHISSTVRYGWSCHKKILYVSRYLVTNVMNVKVTDLIEYAHQYTL